MSPNEPNPKAPGAHWFGALNRVVDVGVLLLSPEQELDYANAAACVLLGYENTDDLRQHWTELRRLLQPGLDRACGEPQSSGPLELETTAQGRTRRLRVELYRLAEQDCDGFLALVKDREMLDALEDELALAIQMRGLTRFYMEVVHDLKAPLNAMVINLELLKDTLHPEENPERYARQRRYIEVLGDEVLRLNRSLTSLLTQTPRLAETSQRFDVRELVQELAALLGPQAKAQHVTIEIAVPQTPLAFVGRRDRVKQALLNIAINALEAMPEGGRLDVRAAREDAAVRLVIRDSGPGIAPEIVGRIYAMHFTTKSGGTGIGLYVARSVVLAHGGTIHVESDVGKGTVVQVTLPLAAD